MPEHSKLLAEIRQTRPFRSQHQEAFLGLLRTAAIVKRPVVKVVERAGLSLAQYNVLRILRGAGTDGLPTLMIRERMLEEAAGITRLIDKLAAAGYVLRERSTPDRRLVVCRITEAGLALLAELDDAVADADRAVLSVLDDDELTRLILLLDKVRGGKGLGVRESARAAHEA